MRVWFARWRLGRAWRKRRAARERQLDVFLGELRESGRKPYSYREEREEREERKSGRRR